jgi:hypothetical protein
MKVERCNPPTSKHFTHYGNKAISINGFDDIIRVTRLKYIRNDPNLYQKFDKFMGGQPTGNIGFYCDKVPCKPICLR